MKLFYRLGSLLRQGAREELFSPTANDIYLVSYPRSGNTWMRAIGAELLYGRSGSSIQDLQRYVPDIHVPVASKDVVPADFHLIKSHFPYLKNHKTTRDYKKIIYIVRDPRDVVISYFRYSQHRDNYSGSFAFFLSDWLNGRIWPCSWQEHVLSWTNFSSQEKDIELCVMRYEDLVGDPETQIAKVASVIGVAVDREAVARVISATSSKEMRLKAESGMPQHEHALKNQFIGPATANQWSKHLTPEQLEQIVRRLGETMKPFGYV